MYREPDYNFDPPEDDLDESEEPDYGLDYDLEYDLEAADYAYDPLSIYDNI